MSRLTLPERNNRCMLAISCVNVDDGFASQTAGADIGVGPASGKTAPTAPPIQRWSTMRSTWPSITGTEVAQRFCMPIMPRFALSRGCAEMACAVVETELAIVRQAATFLGEDKPRPKGSTR